MIFVKLTIVALFIMLVWSMYVTSRMRNDMQFNADVTINKKFPKWYLGYIWFVFGTFIMIFISLVYVLFVIWR